MLPFCSVSNVTSGTFWYHSHSHCDIACGLFLPSSSLRMSSLALLFWNFTVIALVWILFHLLYEPFNLEPCVFHFWEHFLLYVFGYFILMFSTLKKNFLELLLVINQISRTCYPFLFSTSPFESTFWELSLILFILSIEIFISAILF